MDKEKVLKESVKKLVGLNISDKEIIQNLKGVGVDEATAKRMLKETKDGLKEKEPKEEPKKEESQEKESIPDNASKTDEIYNTVYDEIQKEESAQKAPTQTQTIAKPQSYMSDKSISELWEKGILATVNSKLSEIQKIKDQIDSVIEDKVNVLVDKEVKKIGIVMESQNALLNNKIDVHLDHKAGEIKKVIEARAIQMEDLHSKVQSLVVKAQGEKRFNQELLNSLNEKVDGLDAIKTQMISDTNRSLIEMQSEYAEFLDKAKKQQEEMEGRLNRALQLESKITEGLLEDAKDKIQSIKLDKENELSKRIEDKIIELDEMTKDVDPEGINSRLARMKEMENELVKKQKEIDANVLDRFEESEAHIEMRLKQLDAHLAESFTDVKKEFEEHKLDVAKIRTGNIKELEKAYKASVDDLVVKTLTGFDSKMKAKVAELDELTNELDLEKFNATMNSLDLFKKQFVNTVSKSVEDYNKSKKEFAESIIERDNKINGYIQRIDQKMQELSEFEKKFAVEVSSLLDKVPEKKSKSKKSKK